jgi:Mn-dependent DtxR family transcriptional regulator
MKPGPKRKDPEMRRGRRVMVLLTEDEYARVGRLARRMGISMSEYLARPLRKED